MGYEEIRKLAALANGDYTPMADINGLDEDELEIEQEVMADPEPIPMPIVPEYPKLNLKSPGAQQYQDIVSNQMNYFGEQQKKADANYDSILEKRTSLKKPNTDSFDQIMGAMVPLAVAALGGEAGKLSQPGAFKSYQGFLEKDQEKKQKDYEKQLKDNELNLKAAERKSTGFQNKQSNLMTDSAWKTAQMEQAEAKDDKDFDQQIALAKLNASMRKSGQPMSLSDKNIVRSLSNSTAAAMTSLSKFNRLQQQVLNDSFDPKIQVQAVKDELKTLNSPTNPDVVGIQEAARLLTFLNKLPDPLGEKGWKIGYDLPNFRLQLQNSINRLKGLIDDNKASIMEIESPGKAAPSTNIPNAPPPKEPSAKPKAPVLVRPNGQRMILQSDGKYKLEVKK